MERKIHRAKAVDGEDGVAPVLRRAGIEQQNTASPFGLLHMRMAVERGLRPFRDGEGKQIVFSFPDVLKMPVR